MNKPVLFRSNHLYIFGLILLVSGLPVSFFVTSISQFVLAGSFFLEGNFVDKFKRYFRNKPALIITGILVMHVIGLLWTVNYAEGLKDIRIKLPLLILPVIIGGSEPLSKKHFNLVMGFFIAAVFAGTLICMAALTGIIHREITDIREIFIFHVSHIRFALCVCIAGFSLFHYLVFPEYKWSLVTRIGFAVLILWLFVFLIIMESVTGILISVIIISFFLIVRAVKQRNTALRILLLSLAFLIPASLYFSIRTVSDQYFTVKNLPDDVNAKTSLGNSYKFYPEESQFENGYRVWSYVCPEELKPAWDARSAYKYDSLDQRHQYIKYTLIRFLTSKGWKKDAEAVGKLSDKEVKSIEKGIANVNYENLSSMRARILQIISEFDQFEHGGNPSGHSVTQRIEFWKTACNIIKDHPLIGVGTGDMREAYRDKYIEMNSELHPKYRLRAHNQYLAITVAFGFAGLLYFLFALVMPMVMTRKYLDYFYIVFWITAVLSMFTEDTLETQTGATFFALFSCLFLFRSNNDGK